MTQTAKTAAQKLELDKARYARLKGRKLMWEGFAESCSGSIGSGVLLGLLFESYRWLQSGVWHPYRVRPFIDPLIGPEWLAHPTTWIGWHTVLTWLLGLPAFVLAPIAVGSAGWMACETMAQTYREQIDKMPDSARDDDD